MQALRLCTSSLRRHSCGGCAAAAQILRTSSHPIRASQRHSTSPSSSLPPPENETFHERDLKGSTPKSEDSTTVGSAGADACDADVNAEAKRLEARDAIIREILSRDKVIFELKRQHELSMLRVEQNQARVLKDQEDRGMYYEQNSNVHTFDTISVGLYSQRSTLYHTMSAERLRNLKVFLMVLSTVVTCVYLYYRYMINPDWAYVERPIKMLGSRVMAIREQRWKHLTEAQRFDALRDEKNEAA